MELIRYRKVSESELTGKLMKELMAGAYPAFKKDTYTAQRTREILADELRRWTIVEFPKQKPVKPLYRISIPLFFIAWLLLLIGAVIKWFFTGVFFFKYDGKLIKLMAAWATKLNLR